MSSGQQISLESCGMEKGLQDKSGAVSLDSQRCVQSKHAVVRADTHFGVIHRYLRPIREANERVKHVSAWSKWL